VLANAVDAAIQSLWFMMLLPFDLIGLLLVRAAAGGKSFCRMTKKSVRGVCR
jgi:hypothetical protein